VSVAAFVWQPDAFVVYQIVGQPIVWFYLGLLAISLLGYLLTAILSRLR
jgi:hypothetical protein